MAVNTVLSLETNKYEIKLENFEGPLDLLCHLVDKNKMDITKVNISEITDQYIDYINKMEELKLETSSMHATIEANDKQIDEKHKNVEKMISGKDSIY